MSGLDGFSRCETWFGDIPPSLQSHGADFAGLHSPTMKKVLFVDFVGREVEVKGIITSCRIQGHGQSQGDQGSYEYDCSGKGLSERGNG